MRTVHLYPEVRQILNPDIGMCGFEARVSKHGEGSERFKVSSVRTARWGQSSLTI